MENEQSNGVKIHKELCEGIRKWAWETDPETARVVDHQIPVEPYLRLEVVVAQVCIDNKLWGGLGSMMLVAVMSAVMTCFPRMGKAAFLSDLESVIPLSMFVVNRENDKWLKAVEEHAAGNAEPETWTVH